MARDFLPPTGSNFHLQLPSYGENYAFKVRQTQVLSDFAKLRDDYYEKYVENLEKRVTAQRKAFAKARKNTTTEDDIIIKRNHRRRAQKLKFHKLTHDKRFLQNVPKSHFYHLLSVEKLMRERGVLNTREDVDKFWSQVKNDRKLWQRELPDYLDPDAVTEIMVKKYSPKLTTVTDSRHYATCDDEGTSCQSSKGSSEVDENLKFLSEPLKLPKLHVLQSTVVPTCASVASQHDEDKIHPRLFQHRRKVEAYNTSMINSAFSDRLVRTHNLINRHKTLTIKHESPYSTTVTEKKTTAMEEELNTSSNEESTVFITEPVFGNDKVLIPDLEYKYAPSDFQRIHKKNVLKLNKNSHKKKTESHRNHKIKQMEISRNNSKEQSQVQLLSYDMLVQEQATNVKEAKVLSTLWRNYT